MEDFTFNYEDWDDDEKTLDDHHVTEPQTLKLRMGQRDRVTEPKSLGKSGEKATTAASDTYRGDSGSGRKHVSDERG